MTKYVSIFEDEVKTIAGTIMSPDKEHIELVGLDFLLRQYELEKYFKILRPATLYLLQLNYDLQSC